MKGKGLFVCIWVYSRLLFLLSLTVSLSASSFVERRVVFARELIEKDKTKPQGFNDLAFALARRYRETGDPAYLQQANNAIRESLRLAPGNFEGRKARVAVRLLENRFADALEDAQVLSKEVPDDNLMYAYLADAQIALGNYTQAEASAQRMLDLHRVNPPGLQRGARLREEFGDAEGALEWWNSALRLTSVSDTEERAWIGTNIAIVEWRNQKLDQASQTLGRVLAQQVDYPPALAALAQVRMSQGRSDEAVALLRKRLKQGPDLSSQYLLAQALEKSGRPAEAGQAYADFEKAARNHPNPDLILYYADRNAAEAVKLARQELLLSHDVLTLDALAWALYKSGDLKEAKKRMEEALAMGFHDPIISAHAEAIRAKQ